MKKHTLSILLTVFVCASCSAGTETDYDDAVRDDNLDGDLSDWATVGAPEAVGTLKEALGTTESACWTASASKAFQNRFPPVWLTPYVTPSDSYPASGCASAFLVDVTKSQATFGCDVYTNYIAPANLPASASECARWRAGAVAWNKYPDGSYNLVDSKWQWGVWDSTANKCQLSLPVPWVDGWPLRIGATVRRYATAGNANSSYSTKKITFFTLARVAC